MPRKPINVLVIGECGDGKSTLVNGLRDRSKSCEALCGKNPQGVTKQLALYQCPDLPGGLPFNLIDTPGVGDGVVTPVALIGLIEQFLLGGAITGGIQGVIVTTPIPDGRIRLGAQVVQVIVDKGFLGDAGADKYASVILAGTKADKADADEKRNFERGVDGGKSVRELFFKGARPAGQGCAVMVHRGCYQPLLHAVLKLPAASIKYKAPNATVMATALAETFGMSRKDAAEGVACMRESELKDLQREVADHKEQLSRLEKEKEEQLRAQVAERERSARMWNRISEQMERQRQIQAEALEMRERMKGFLQQCRGLQRCPYCKTSLAETTRLCDTCRSSTRRSRFLRCYRCDYMLCSFVLAEDLARLPPCTLTAATGDGAHLESFFQSLRDTIQPAADHATLRVRSRRSNMPLASVGQDDFPISVSVYAKPTCVIS